MGKQAATKVLAGAEGTGTAGKVFPETPTLRLVSSPKRQKILEGMLEVVGTSGYDAASVREVLVRTGCTGRPSTTTSPTRRPVTWRHSTSGWRVWKRL